MGKLIKNKYEAHIIGGAIRDRLLHLEPKDYDIFTNATGEQILKIFPRGTVIGGEERQNKILTVIVDGVEISQYRNNGDRTKTGSSLEEHQATCDFTINSIAMDINEKIIDKHNGQNDLETKTLRFVGVPFDRIKEDPLRILRGIRFWTKYRGMRFEDIRVVLDNMDILDTLPKERIRDELIKIIKYPQGIINLWCDGIIYKIFPELAQVEHMKGGDFHDETVDAHMRESFKIACDVTSSPLLRLACFLHDIGKGITYTEAIANEVILSKDGSPMLERVEQKIHFYEHENKGQEMMEKRLAHLKFSNDDIKYIGSMIRLHMYSYKTDPSKKSYIKFFNKLEQAKIPIEDYIILIYCDHQANLAKPRIKFGDFIKGNWLLKKYYEIKFSEEPMKVSDLKVSGVDVMKIRNIKSGKEVGVVLRNLFELVMDGELKNKRAELLNKLKGVIE